MHQLDTYTHTHTHTTTTRHAHACMHTTRHEFACIPDLSSQPNQRLALVLPAQPKANLGSPSPTKG